MRCLIGIDDTDNAESRGTGFRARQLGARLGEAGIGRLSGITRHQLFVHPDIPYTSHNSAACLDFWLEDTSLVDVVAFCRRYLAEESAPGSDAGLCVAAFDSVHTTMVEFAQAAKHEILDRDAARDLAAGVGVHLEGVTGDEMGVIGALAAVGLRRSGHDGRFIWLAGVRELTGTATADWLLANTGIAAVETVDGRGVSGDARILVDPWPRPVLLNDRAILLVRESLEENHANNDWELLPKETIRRY